MTPLCRKCLLVESGDELYRTILEYVAAIPLNEKTPEEEYITRLEICKACDNLTNGMCILCGCYVELRAAKKIQRCVKYDW